MSSYSTNEFKSGLKIILDGDPYTIVENEFVKPGKGQAFNRVRIRNLKTGRTLERNFKSGDTVEAADVVEVDMQYLYNDGDFWHFMVPDNFEQHTAGKEALGGNEIWLKDGISCKVMLWNGVPLAVEPPAHVELKIVETDPGLRGDTATGGQKPAKLETGAMVRVPLFLNEGEVIRVEQVEADPVELRQAPVQQRGHVGCGGDQVRLAGQQSREVAGEVGIGDALVGRHRLQFVHGAGLLRPSRTGR